MVPARFLFRFSIRLVSIVCVALVGQGFTPARAMDQGSNPVHSSVTGTVLDPDGRPVANAEVLLTQAASVAARARTDASGAFRADWLPAGRYEVHVALEGFRADPLPIAVAGGESRRSRFVFI